MLATKLLETLTERMVRLASVVIVRTRLPVVILHNSIRRTASDSTARAMSRLSAENPELVYPREDAGSVRRASKAPSET